MGKDGESDNEHGGRGKLGRGEGKSKGYKCEGMKMKD